MYSRIVVLLASLFLLPTALLAQNQRVLTETEYRQLLDCIDIDMQTWQRMLSSIDPGKGDAPYKVGVQIDTDKSSALKEVQYAIALIPQQRAIRTVYGEFVLANLLNGVFSFGAELVSLGTFNEKSVDEVSHLSKELSEVQIQVNTDALGRLKILESESCASLK